jgi:carnitine O-acetyltransferase
MRRSATLISVPPTPSVMLSKQSTLPRLPLPSLEDSLARYLAATAPLVTPSQHTITRAIVSAALDEGSPLRQLQHELVARDAKASDPSYVSAAWDNMYLDGRWPLAINSNPCAVNRVEAFGERRTQLERAARIVTAAVAVSQEVAAGTLRPDRFKGMHLDMRQYASAALPA